MVAESRRLKKRQRTGDPRLDEPRCESSGVKLVSKQGNFWKLDLTGG